MKILFIHLNPFWILAAHFLESTFLVE